MITEETLYWILSTLPQVLGAMTALIMAGISFFFENLNEEVEKEESKETVVYEIKKVIFHRTILLLAISIIAIIIDVSFIGLTPWLAEKIKCIHNICCGEILALILFWASVIGLNLYSFIIIIQLLRRILNPDFYKDINNILARKEKKDIPDADSVSPQDFIDLFIKLERVVRSYFPETAPFKGSGLRSLILQLINEGILEKKDLNIIQNIINKRNIYVHGGDIGRVSKLVMDELSQYIVHLEEERPNYMKQRGKSRMEESFHMWISKYVEDYSDATELEQAVRDGQDNGKFRVLHKGDKLIILVESGRSLYLNDENDKKLFLDILRERYGLNPDK